MSDGGDNVQNLHIHISPDAEHLLDWFLVTMRSTVLGRMVKGSPQDAEILNDVPKWG